MEQIAGQISIFDLLTEDEPEKPHISNRLEPWDFHEGVKGWMIHAVWFAEGPHVPEWLWGCVVTYTDRWVSTKEPKLKDDGWSTAGELVRRKGDTYSCWYGGFRTLYRQTPTFDERIEAAHRSREYRPGMRIIDADCVVALEGPPLSEAEKETIRKLHFH